MGQRDTTLVQTLWFDMLGVSLDQEGAGAREAAPVAQGTTSDDSACPGAIQDFAPRGEAATALLEGAASAVADTPLAGGDGLTEGGVGEGANAPLVGGEVVAGGRAGEGVKPTKPATKRRGPTNRYTTYRVQFQEALDAGYREVQVGSSWYQLRDWLKSDHRLDDKVKNPPYNQPEHDRMAIGRELWTLRR